MTHHIENFIATKVFPDNRILQEMKNQMQNRFSEYKNLDNFNAIFITATLLDLKFALILNKIQIDSAIVYLETFSNEDSDTECTSQEISQNTAQSFTNIQNLIISQLSQEKKKSESKVCDEVNYYLEYLKTKFLKDFDLKVEFFGNNSIEFNEKFILQKT